MRQLLIFVAVLISLVNGKRNNDTVKALWNLERMSECRLGYSALNYNDYGCWCGVGGSGLPVDGIDECCMLHDHCYDKAIDTHMCFDVPVEYVEDYSWACNTSANGNEPFCYEKQSQCKDALCWCDKMVVDCWAQYPKPPFKKTCLHPRSNKPIKKGNEDVSSPGFFVNFVMYSVEHIRKMFAFLF